MPEPSSTSAPSFPAPADSPAGAPAAGAPAGGSPPGFHADSPADAAVREARRRAWLTLSLTAGLGPITLRRAVQHAFGVLGVLKFSASDFAEVEGIGSVKAAQILRDLPRARTETDDVLARCHPLGIQVVTPDDDTYPALLRDLPDAPPVLYVRGTLEPRDLSAVAIVGSRQCSFYGKDQASRFASLLAGAGVTVVSGGARGVDSAGHEGALRVPGGRTLAVLGCGVDVAYPPENKPLFDRLATGEQGAVISHYPPGTPPNQRHFPERNRVISALSRAVFVVEADERSGSLITARLAADDHNRPVLALPGRVDNPLSAGPHKLIKDGAVVVTCLEDILDNLGPVPHSATQPRTHAPPSFPPASSFPSSPSPRTSGPQSSLDFSPPPPPPPTAPPAATLTPDQQALLAAFRDNPGTPLHVETLLDATGLPPSTVLQSLTLLTLKGHLKRVEDQTYALR